MDMGIVKEVQDCINLALYYELIMQLSYDTRLPYTITIQLSVISAFKNGPFLTNTS
jgi:hypothetical protein